MVKRHLDERITFKDTIRLLNFVIKINFYIYIYIYSISTNHRFVDVIFLWRKKLSIEKYGSLLLLLLLLVRNNIEECCLFYRNNI